MDHPEHTPEFDDPRSDHQLVDAINRGDIDAFEALYQRHRDWVVNLAFRFTGNRDLALDVLQETFLYLLKKFPGFQLTARLQTFLYTAVKNLSIAARRKLERLSGDAAALESMEAPTSNPSAATNHDAMAAVMAGLSEEHREVLMLRFVDGMSLAEVAECLAIPPGTAKSRLHNALKTLREDERTRHLLE